MKETKTKEFPFTLTKMGEDGTDEEGTFTGYASIFNVTDSYGDIVMPGAFKRTLKNKKQFPILWSHSIMEPVGMLTGVEDDKGLVVNGRLTKGVQKAQELRALMKDGAVNGLSIGYQVMKQEEDKEEDVRRLKEINLWEVSLCVFQACPGANVTAVKSGDDPTVCASCGQEISLSEEDSAKATSPERDSNNRPSDPATPHSLKVRATAEMIGTLRQELFRR